MATEREAIIAVLREHFESRAAAQGWKAKRRAEKRLEFLMGAHAALTALGQPGLETLLLLASIGNDVLSEPA